MSVRPLPLHLFGSKKRYKYICIPAWGCFVFKCVCSLHFITLVLLFRIRRSCSPCHQIPIVLGSERGCKGRKVGGSYVRSTPAITSIWIEEEVQVYLYPRVGMLCFQVCVFSSFHHFGSAFQNSSILFSVSQILIMTSSSILTARDDDGFSFYQFVP